MLRALAAEEERWWRLVDGTGWEGPERRWLEWWSEASGKPVRSDVEEVLETTEALWAARSMDSSRVRRFTTASCSFSSCRCKSAAVRGLGCLSGPGPVPTPVLSPELPYAGNGVAAAAAAAACVAVGCDEAAMNALVFEGRILGTGAARGKIGGVRICCDARREVGAVPVTRGDCEVGCGDGGTELRSGAMLIASFDRDSREQPPFNESGPQSNL